VDYFHYFLDLALPLLLALGFGASSMSV
jgi:hypothetical protein